MSWFSVREVVAVKQDDGQIHLTVQIVTSREIADLLRRQLEVIRDGQAAIGMDIDPRLDHALRDLSRLDAPKLQVV